jgi:hypothetical protein
MSRPQLYGTGSSGVGPSSSRPPIWGAALLFVLTSCGGGQTTSGTEDLANLNFTSPYAELNLTPPANLVTPPPGTGVGGVIPGASFAPNSGAQNVTVQAEYGRFSPNWGISTKQGQQRLATATYWLDMSDLTESTALLLDWQGQPTSENAWVGLANWGSNRWVWQRLDSTDYLPVTNMAPYIRSTDKLLACTILLVGTQPTLLAQVSHEAPPPAVGLLNEDAHLGIAPFGISDWSPASPFVDVFKTAREWIPQDVVGGPFDNGHSITTDADGWVTSLDPGQAVATMMIKNSDGWYPAGEYICLYDGEGTITFEADASVAWSTPGRMGVNITPTNTTYTLLRITATNPANYIRNIRLIMPGFETTHETAIFHPDFLASLSNFDVLRFMDFGATNYSEVSTWADRTTPNSLSQARQKGPHAGACLEYMVDLANTNLSDAWICLPYLVDDDFVRNAAILIRDRLDARLRVFIEYSNEVWNRQFPVASYAENKGLALGLSSDPFEARLRYYSQRSQEIHRIFTEAFAGQTDRLVRIAAGQSNPWTGTTILDWDGTQGFVDANTVSDRFDKYAIAPYFGGYLGKNPQAYDTVNMTIAEVLTACDDDSIRFNGPSGTTEKNFFNATTRGIPLIAYEGGQHLAPVGVAKEVQALVDLFISANRDMGMRQVYFNDLARWNISSGGGLMVTYAYISDYSKHGSWGIFESQGQNLATAPKWLGLMDWLAVVSEP